MITTYKSSSLTIIVKYFITPLITLLFFSELLLLLTGSTFGPETLFELPLLAWITLVININSIYLKRVEAQEKYLIIKSSLGDQIVNYQNVKWLSQTYFGRPALYIRYQTESGKLKTISTIPRMYNKSQFSKLLFNPYQELEMTSFIRGQVKQFQPEYNSDSEPSSWKLFFIMLLSGLPFLALSLFMAKW